VRSVLTDVSLKAEDTGQRVGLAWLDTRPGKVSTEKRSMTAHQLMRLALLLGYALSWQTSKAEDPGLSEPPYLYKNDYDEHGIMEYTSTGGHFEDSDKPRVVAFYSPQCVSYSNLQLAFSSHCMCYRKRCAYQLPLRCLPHRLSISLTYISLYLYVPSRLLTHLTHFCLNI
jgi:hypothetical protein